MIYLNRIVISALIIFLGSCNETSVDTGINHLTKDSKSVEVKLIDSLGTIILSVPLRYDTLFTWIDYSDCGKSCNRQKYRFQPKFLRITKETGWIWQREPIDSVDRFTISHSGYFPFHNGDSTKSLTLHNHLKSQLTSDLVNLRIIFDTVQKIGDRYFSIFAMQKLDTIQSIKVIAATTIKGNLIRFQYELLTRQNDSIARNFISNSIELIRTIHISKGI